ncbi:uncharacterized protein TrAtP1_006259 [Trichoderma atroviride]|uniref:uncharacterized protein n=1 Tax=Hypocrea atroviridis TaxID=63577 RepID=UPI00332B473C|nr:hypothetical protein TrAtP1_006259 [Trichoderma atroviride]
MKAWKMYPVDTNSALICIVQRVQRLFYLWVIFIICFIDIILRRSTIGAYIDSLSLSPFFFPSFLLTMHTQKLVTDFFTIRVTANSSIDEETAAVLSLISADGGINSQESERRLKGRTSKSQEASIRANSAKVVTRSAPVNITSPS